jgi:hypothetical protein
MTKMLFKAKKIKIKWCQRAFSSFHDAFLVIIMLAKGKSDIWLKKIQACMTPSLACWKCSRPLCTTSRRSQIPYLCDVGRVAVSSSFYGVSTMVRRFIICSAFFFSSSFLSLPQKITT